VAWGTFPRESLRIVRGALREHHSTPPVARGACPTCGGCLTYRHAARAAEIDVTLASLDDPAVLTPQMHVWVAERLPWVQLADGLPQYPGAPP
jgi:hypothetical protein